MIKQTLIKPAIIMPALILVILAGCGTSQDILQAQPSSPVALADGETYQLEILPVLHTVNGRSLQMLGYNGQIPGPLLQVRQGARVMINVTSRIPYETTVHWHGIRLENKYDGVPGVTQQPILLGESFLYVLDFPDEGIYWYHPHVREDMQQELGLYGAIVVEPTEQLYRPAREIVLMIDDIALQGSGIVPFGAYATHTLMGRYGNVMLVNGNEQIDLDAKTGELLRLFLVNTANARPMNIAVVGKWMTLVGRDSRQEQDEEVSSIMLSPAERAIVEVQFDAPGSYQLVHQTPERTYELGTIRVEGDGGQSLPAADALLQPSQSSFPPIDAAAPPDYTLDLTIDMSVMEPGMHMAMMGGMHGGVRPIEWEDDMQAMNAQATSRNIRWVIRDPLSGKENMNIHPVVSQGEFKRIRIVNTRSSMHPMQHPIHLHGQRFLVAAIDGKPVTNRAWRDTVLVPAGSTADLLVAFTNPGEWMLHCHIAEHLEAGMMMAFSVV